MTWCDESGTSNCTRLPRCTRWPSRARRRTTPTSSAASADRGGVGDRRARWRCGRRAARPARRRCASRSSRATRRVGSMRVDRRHRRVARSGTSRCPPACGRRRCTQSAVAPSSTSGLSPSSTQRPPRAGGPGAHPLDRVVVAELLERDGARWSCRTRGRAAGGRARAASAAVVAQTDDDRNGPGSVTRPISSSTTTASTSPRPSPPDDSGTSSAGHPSSPSDCHISLDGVVVTVDHGPDPTVADQAGRARRARWPRSASCSAEKVKSMGGCRSSQAAPSERPGPECDTHVIFGRWTSPSRAEDEAFRAELREWLDRELPRFLDDWSPSDGDGDGASRELRPHPGPPQGLAAPARRGSLGGHQLAAGVARARGHAGAERDLRRGDGPGAQPRASTTRTASGRSVR